MAAVLGMNKTAFHISIIIQEDFTAFSCHERFKSYKARTAGNIHSLVTVLTELTWLPHSKTQGKIQNKIPQVTS
jgi:hypothetical protein